MLSRLSRHTGAKIGGYSRGIAEWLLIGSGDTGYRIDDILWRHLILMHFSTETLAGCPRKAQLVITRLIETDRVSLWRLAAHLAKHAGHRRAVCTARKKGPHPAIRNVSDRGFQQAKKFLLQICEISRTILLVRQLPVTSLFDLPVVHRRPAGTQASDTLIDRLRGWNHMKIEIIVKCLRTKFTRHAQPMQNIHARGKCQTTPR